MIIDKLFKIFGLTSIEDKVAMTMIFVLKTASLFLCAYIAGASTSSDSLMVFKGVESVFWSSAILFVIIYSALTTLIYVFKSIVFSKQTKELLGAEYCNFSTNYLAVFLMISGLGLVIIGGSYPYFSIGFFMISRLNSLEQIAIFLHKENRKEP